MLKFEQLLGQIKTLALLSSLRTVFLRFSNVLIHNSALCGHYHGMH